MLPEWLRQGFPDTDCIRDIRVSGIKTICQSSSCPNLPDCFSRGHLTFLVLGDICTRRCAFCGLGHGKPQALDKEEPENIRKAAKGLGLKHVVITSVTRDDLPDKGLGHFIRIQERLDGFTMELLIPFFTKNDVERLLKRKVRVLAHNIETVERLFPSIRPGFSYRESLNLLKSIKDIDPRQSTKSGIMLGLGETRSEVERALIDMRRSKVDRVTIGQYLRPSMENIPVRRYYHPREFQGFKAFAEDLGLTVSSGWNIRSSYVNEKNLKITH